MEPSTAATQSATTADPRPHLALALAETGRIVGGVAPHQLHGPTPCEEFDVERLLGHLVMVVQRIGAAG